jgi:hypothetical protein
MVGLFLLPCRPPSLGRPACYVLRRPMWCELDPHFVQYGPQLRHAAQERAGALGDYKPHMQLATPRHPPPACMPGLLRLPAHPEVRAVGAGLGPGVSTVDTIQSINAWLTGPGAVYAKSS